MQQHFTARLMGLTLAGCLAAGTLVAQQAQQNSLYDRLGGKTAIIAVVDDLWAWIGGSMSHRGDAENQSCLPGAWRQLPGTNQQGPRNSL